MNTPETRCSESEILGTGDEVFGNENAGLSRMFLAYLGSRSARAIAAQAHGARRNRMLTIEATGTKDGYRVITGRCSINAMFGNRSHMQQQIFVASAIRPPCERWQHCVRGLHGRRNPAEMLEPTAVGLNSQSSSAEKYFGRLEAISLRSCRGDALHRIKSIQEPLMPL